MFQKFSEVKKYFFQIGAHIRCRYPIGGKDANYITAWRPLRYGRRILMKVDEHRVSQETLLPSSTSEDN